MTIAYSEVGLYCELNETQILNLVIENQQIFSNIISDIYYQINGGSGKFVLSDNNNPLDLKKNVELVTQIIPFEINQRELLNKLYAELKNISVDGNNYQLTQQLFSDISSYVYTLTEDLENDISVDVPQDINGILKMLGIRFTEHGTELTDKILEYMIAVNKFKGGRVFIFVNLRSYLTDSQIELLYKDILLRKMTVICIESSDHKRLPNTKTIIIDKDMCII